MANKATKAKASATRKAKQHFHGKICLTSFADKAKNPDNKRRSPWRGCAKSVSGKRNTVVDLMAA
jgi:hypothetical protein